MIDVFLQTLPFFAIIGIGYLAGRSGFFPEAATAYLTKFVFFFALSAMLFRFAANLSLGEVLDWNIIYAYLAGTTAIYIVATFVSFLRKQSVEVAAVEAQCAVIGNTGFLGIPMMAVLMGPESIGPVMLILAVDLIVFSSLIVILINGARDGRMSFAIFKTVGVGLIKNPMIVSISLGLIWSSLDWPMPEVLNSFLVTLGAAATPGALFAIGASLASKSAERMSVAGWLSFCKLVLHPLAVAGFALLLFNVATFEAGVIIACSALPVAGNVFMLAQHYGVAPQRVSASILISTAISIVTFSATVGWVALL
ncbi:AEC family transporter [Cognatishimia activa]|uniref:Auxin efflux carrier n=1 Tax=Cognatishimia activa TaxID=1715691 RepID=A0A0N7MB90_9RHOB|nr:AEC family transporter [Cognatishimia activa]CUI36592.1 auxin efflux carrier [Cognatishimia activa]CUK24744.1 auxin efflux carrier [Cognatishimia activa]